MTYPMPSNRPYTLEEVLGLMNKKAQRLSGCARREGGGWSQEVMGAQVQIIEELLVTIQAGRFPQ